MSKRPIGHMTPEVFERVLQQLKTVGISSAGLHTVGETFMYKDLEKLFAIAKKYNFSIWLSTNGQFPGRIEKLYNEFPEMANSYRISIDGAKRETYEYIRQGASFDRLITSLEVIQKINKGKRNYNISLCIDSVLSTTNIFEIPLFFEVFKKYCWPQDINFSLINGLSPDPSVFRDTFPFPNLIKPIVPCHMPFKYIYFTYGGKATLCCRDYEEELVIGDIQQNSIVELWNSEAAEEIREKHLNPKKMDIRACRMCYGPDKSLSEVVNEYIHFLIARYPRLTPQQFGEKVMSLLKYMNENIKSEDTDVFRENIGGFFK